MLHVHSVICSESINHTGVTQKLFLSLELVSYIQNTVSVGMKT